MSESASRPLMPAVDGGGFVPTELAVERIRAAAPQRDRKEDEPPEQGVFPSASAPGEPLRPVGDERDDRELDGKGSRNKPREQPQHDQYRADRLKKEHRVGRGHRRLDSAAGHAAGGEGLDGRGEAFFGHRHHLHNPMHEQHPTRREADDEP